MRKEIGMLGIERIFLRLIRQASCLNEFIKGFSLDFAQPLLLSHLK